ncbi:MAG: FG-GAP-like repeat-containing protein [Planctomycetota bacterium]
MRQSLARLFLQSVALPTALVVLLGCGSGTVAIIEASSGDGGGGQGNQLTEVRELWLEDPDRESPATIRWVLADQESDRADVAVLVIPGLGESEELVPGGTLTALSTSPQGTQHSLSWEYAARFGNEYTPDVSIAVRVLSNPDAPGQGEYDRQSAAPLGNSEPAVTSITVPQEEVAGIALIQFKTSDSSSDLLRVRVEYEIGGGQWQSASPAGSSLDGEGYLDVDFRPGNEPVYYWNVIKDLGGSEHHVTVRLTPKDALLKGDPVTSAPFTIDNNARPAVVPDHLGLFLNTDSKGRIALPFTVFDDESDPVQLVFQWCRYGESFDDEGLGDPDSIRAILADPELRREKKICTESPVAYQGRVALVDPAEDPEGRRVRLPELASSAAGLLGSGGVVGRELQILRAPLMAEVLDAFDGLSGPVAVLPVGDGVDALVLDGAWRLRRYDLATGSSVEVASGQGVADAMAYEAGETSVLVASSMSNTWSVSRVRLASEPAVVEELVSSRDGDVEVGRIRGITSLSPNTAVVTVGSSLIQLEYAEGAPRRAVTLLSDLRTPWGVVKDPLHPNRVYLAERDWDPDADLTYDVTHVSSLIQGRVVALDLNAHGSVTIPGLPRPRALALENTGTRLLAVTDKEGDGILELRGIDHLTGGEAFEILDGLEGDRMGLACGPLGLRMLALDSSNRVFAGGGVEQKRQALSYDTTNLAVTVAEPFQPRPRPGDSWRIVDSSRPEPTSPAGEERVFVWDSKDVAEGGEVRLRIIPLDSDLGGIQEYDAVRQTSRVDFATQEVADLEMYTQYAVAAADLDGDGDLDLVSANYNGRSLTIFFQTSPGTFTPDVNNPHTDPDMGEPTSVAAADLDGDGDLDLVSAYPGSYYTPGNLTIFFQTSPGIITPDPNNPHMDPHMEGPQSVAAADLDGDGDLDLVSANVGYYPDKGNLTILLQTAPGIFTSDPNNPHTDPDMDVPQSVAAADLDDDGDVDLVSGNRDSLTVFFQTSPGIFTRDPNNPHTDPDMEAAYSVTAGDLDADGDLDLVSATPYLSYAPGNLTIFFQTSPGIFRPDPDNPHTDPGMDGSYSVVAADLDGDGDLDLVSANYGARNVTIFFQTSPGVFAADRTNPHTDPDVLGPCSVAAADLDGDGDLDLASGNEGSHNLTIFFQTNAGFLTPDANNPHTDPDMIRAVYVAAADLDSDGDLDLVLASAGHYAPGNLTIFFQTSPGVFTADPNNPHTDPDILVTHSVAAADLDGDGDVDLVSANFLPSLTILFQTSPGIFTRDPNNPHTDPDMGNYGSVVAADLDGDGDLDLVSATSDNLTIFFGDH